MKIGQEENWIDRREEYVTSTVLRLLDANGNSVYSWSDDADSGDVPSSPKVIRDLHLLIQRQVEGVDKKLAAALDILKKTRNQ